MGGLDLGKRLAHDGGAGEVEGDGEEKAALKKEQLKESAAARRTENIYDETAVVGLPKFASRLQLGFFPPNGRAFKLAPGPEFPKESINKT